ncbi:hypothetical protein DFS34DRAFT_649052 [Phlyctochytrium arcticum]|nr:hypothetical protein DFS34DRAFT_649052 [Phlyctochytrium arcticum]
MTHDYPILNGADDPTLPANLAALLSSVSGGGLASSEDGAGDADLALLDQMDVAGLMKQMDTANNALDHLESRTDSLMQKIDAILQETTPSNDEDDSAQSASNIPPVDQNKSPATIEKDADSQ